MFVRPLLACLLVLGPVLMGPAIVARACGEAELGRMAKWLGLLESKRPSVGFDQCDENIRALLQAALDADPQLNLDDTFVLLMVPVIPGDRFNGFGTPHLPHPSWQYHVVLEHQGRILDFDLADPLRAPKTERYLAEMFTFADVQAEREFNWFEREPVSAARNLGAIGIRRVPARDYLQMRRFTWPDMELAVRQRPEKQDPVVERAFPVKPLVELFGSTFVAPRVAAASLHAGAGRFSYLTTSGRITQVSWNVGARLYEFMLPGRRFVGVPADQMRPFRERIIFEARRDPRLAAELDRR